VGEQRDDGAAHMREQAAGTQERGEWRYSPDRPASAAATATSKKRQATSAMEHAVMQMGRRIRYRGFTAKQM